MSALSGLERPLGENFLRLGVARVIALAGMCQVSYPGDATGVQLDPTNEPTTNKISCT
jgi:hypothetical protein